MVESDMQTLFRKHLEKHPPDEPEIYELKICKDNKPLPFDRLLPHQREALLGAQGAGYFHKLTDPPVYAGMKTRFNKTRPFDCMYLVNVNAYVIVWWYEPRQTKVFIKIPILKFVEEKELSTRKSLTQQRALEIGKPFILDP